MHACLRACPARLGLQACWPAHMPRRTPGHVHVCSKSKQSRNVACTRWLLSHPELHNRCSTPCPAHMVFHTRSVTPDATHLVLHALCPHLVLHTLCPHLVLHALCPHLVLHRASVRQPVSCRQHCWAPSRRLRPPSFRCTTRHGRRLTGGSCRRNAGSRHAINRRKLGACRPGSCCAGDRRQLGACRQPDHAPGCMGGACDPKGSPGAAGPSQPCCRAWKFNAPRCLEAGENATMC